MSGIGGYLRFDEAPVAQAEVERMGRVLERYGPDGEHAWRRGSYGVVHRLMRITPEDAFERQPVVGAGGRLVLVADVRLDNRHDLASRLGWSPQRARMLPDSAFVLAAYEKWGLDSPQHLLGAFAFAVYDTRERRLFLARDQMGRRVLFYYRDARRFVFSTVPKGILCIPEVPRRLNEGKLAEFLVLNHLDHEGTFYEEIHRLPPAHSLTVTAEGLKTRRYWALDPEKRIHLAGDGAYLEQASALLEEAVRCRLRSAHPVGAFLSGGLDASTVACVAADQLRAQGRSLPAFTSVPRAGYDGPARPGWYNDETPFVEAIQARNGNIEVHYVRAEARTPLDDLARRNGLLEAPVRNVFGQLFMEAICEEASAQGIRVLLEGQMGNRSLSWDGVLQLTDLAAGGRWIRLAREVRALRREKGGTYRAWLGNALRPLLPEGVWDRRVRARKGNRVDLQSFTAVRSDFLDDVDIAARNQRAGHDLTYRPLPGGRLQRAQALNDGVDYQGDLLALFLASFGVEIRDPLADVRLLEYCLAIPQEQFMQGGQTRLLIRRLMKGRLPDVVLDNPRRGAQMPDWHERLTAVRDELRTEVQALRRSDVANKVLDLDRLEALVDDWPEEGWQQRRQINQYRLLVTRGIVAGRFIRWFEGDNV